MTDTPQTALKSECPDLVFSNEGGRLRVKVQAAALRKPLDNEILRGLLAKSGFENFLITVDALSALLERYHSTSDAFDLVLGESKALEDSKASGKSESNVAAEPIAAVDAAPLSIELASDAMQAWANYTGIAGGHALAVDDVLAALEAAKVVFGIDLDAVKALCMKSESALSEPVRVLVASGTAVADGEDTRFEMLIDDARDRAPQVNEHGLIDFREQGAIPMVVAEQPLMRRIPPTAGKAGQDVRGTLIEPTQGRSEAFAEHLVGAYQDKEDANLLRAVVNGQPVRCGNGVNVEQVLHVRNVNMASGNISFDGTVNISGEVLPGMKVHATGDIVVGDIVDGAELDAGGDVRVSGGIIAKAVVRAAGSVTARFTEGAHVFAGTIISIDDTALQSELQANNQIFVGLNSPQRGKLAGGSARAMMLIKTPILGAASGGVTTLQLGVNPVLEAEYQAMQKKISTLREEEEKLEKLVKHLAKQGDKSGMLERANASWQAAVKAWGRALPERDELEKKLALMSDARVEVGVCVDGAVDLSFGHKSLHVRQAFDQGFFMMNGERIVFVDASAT